MTPCFSESKQLLTENAPTLSPQGKEMQTNHQFDYFFKVCSINIHCNGLNQIMQNSSTVGTSMNSRQNKHLKGKDSLFQIHTDFQMAVPVSW